MTVAHAIFDILGFVKKLEAAGVEPKIAEAQAELQADFQSQILEKFAEYQPLLEEIKATKHEFATKTDIAKLDHKIDSNTARLEHKIDSVHSELKAEMRDVRSEIKALRNELIVKIGGIVVACMTVFSTIMAFLINHAH